MRICVKRVCLLSLIVGIRWGGKVVAGWDDKGVGIIVACKNYEKDNGQSSEYEKEYIKKYKYDGK